MDASRGAAGSGSRSPTARSAWAGAIPAGQIPTGAEALDRIEQLRQQGPSDDVFPFRAAR
ncbi:MAG: DUF3291 domain-containing protein [Actinomycetota bacterium]